MVMIPEYMLEYVFTENTTTVKSWNPFSIDIKKDMSTSEEFYISPYAIQSWIPCDELVPKNKVDNILDVIKKIVF